MIKALSGVELLPQGSVTSARGFRAGAAAAGIKDGESRLDLAVVVADTPCTAHAVFTQCAIVAAPVILSRERIASGHAQGIVLNSGNANACNGQSGMAAARTMADATARKLGIDPQLMLVASTGVIGVPLPIDRVQRGIEALAPTTDGGHDAARAIMTTDLCPKEAAAAIEIAGYRITVGGMAKGSGMIHPNLATMLAVVTTDAALHPLVARSALRAAAETSFNQVTVDRDTSTNDMLALFASGASGAPVIQPDSLQAVDFANALEVVCIALARQIARDGEGASRLITSIVEGARNDVEARRAAREIVSSSLVKAAVYGRDPNWGRILAAIGNSGISLDPDTVDISIGNIPVAAGGSGVPFDTAEVSAAMGAEEVVIRSHLHGGFGRGEAWGCDLTEDYVVINSAYTT